MPVIGRYLQSLPSISAYASSSTLLPLDDGPSHVNLVRMRKVDTIYQYAEHKKFIVRLVVTVVASMSVVATLISFYWFSRMNKRFRHKLIMLLMFGAFVRAFAYVLYAANTFIRHDYGESSVICKASGWMVSWGVESNDFAALFMAIHSGLQIFRPQNSPLVSDGLYNYRRSVYFIILGLPCLLASVAFARPEMAYTPQGPFCTLPIRPTWYRLVLAWIPRYIIMLTIIALAIAIYVYVGIQFKSYARQHPESSVELSATIDTLPQMSTNSQATAEPRRSSDALQVPQNTHGAGNSERGGRSSLNVTFSDDPIDESSNNPSKPQACSMPDNIDPFSLMPECPIPQRKSRRISTFNFGSFTKPLKRASLDSSGSSGSPPGNSRGWGLRGGKLVITPLERRRQNIHRQLRLLFVYPGIYIAMWIIPSVLVFMQYDDRFAQSPPFFMSLLAFVSITSMGVVDAMVFSFRERPWRRIIGSDGTFWGSFVFWRHFKGDISISRRGSQSAEDIAAASSAAVRAHRGSRDSCDSSATGPGGASTAAVAAPKRRSKGLARFWPQTGKTDREKAAAEQAYVRLAVERADTARQRLEGTGNERVSEETQQQANWWDRWHGDEEAMEESDAESVAP